VVLNIWYLFANIQAGNVSKPSPDIKALDRASYFLASVAQSSAPGRREYRENQLNMAALQKKGPLRELSQDRPLLADSAMVTDNSLKTGAPS
jgi:hypothetical protein